jgi:hypothetical protein
MEPASITSAARWPAWTNAAVLMLASWIAVAALSLQVGPGAEIVAVAFPPWWGTERAFLAAARITALPSVLVVRPDQHDGLARLREAGAWLAIDPQAIAACL